MFLKEMWKCGALRKSLGKSRLLPTICHLCHQIISAHRLPQKNWAKPLLFINLSSSLSPGFFQKEGGAYLMWRKISTWQIIMWEKSPHGRSSCGKILHMADCHVEKFLHMRNGVMWRNNVSKINFFEIYAILWRKGKCPTSISSKRLEGICPIAGKKENEEQFSYCIFIS